MACVHVVARCPNRRGPQRASPPQCPRKKEGQELEGQVSHGAATRPRPSSCPRTAPPPHRVALNPTPPPPFSKKDSILWYDTYDEYYKALEDVRRSAIANGFTGRVREADTRCTPPRRTFALRPQPLRVTVPDSQSWYTQTEIDTQRSAMDFEDIKKKLPTEIKATCVPLPAGVDCPSSKKY